MKDNNHGRILDIIVICKIYLDIKLVLLIILNLQYNPNYKIVYNYLDKLLIISHRIYYYS